MAKFIINPTHTQAKEITLALQNKVFQTKDTPTANRLWGIFPLDETAAFAVGDLGTIVKYNSNTFQFETDAQSGIITTKGLYAVYLVSGSIGIAVGEDSTILRYDGSVWAASADSGNWPDSQLMAVYHFGGFIVACGWDDVTGDSVIYHKGFYYDSSGSLIWRTNWAEVYRKKFGSGSYGLRKILPPAVDEVYCIGDAGTCLLSTDWGNTWKEVSTGTTENLFGGYLIEGFGFIVGENGVIIKYDGSDFSVFPTPTTADLRNAWFSSEEFGFAVGDGGKIISWDGNRWRDYSSPTGYSIYDINGITNNFCWLTGQAGYIAQFQAEVYPSRPVDSSGGTLDYRMPEADTIVDALAITDTNAHDPDSDSEVTISCLKLYRDASIRIVNGLNQAISVQVYGNTADSTTNAVTVGVAFNVAAGDSQIRTIIVNTAGWYDYLYLKITAAVAPASGTVTATISKKTGV